MASERRELVFGAKMGNLVISPAMQKKLREEGRHAKRLLEMEGQNSQEQELIDKTRRDQQVKVWMSAGVGFSFGLSLKRYFPESVAVASAGMYTLAMLSLIAPCVCLASVYTNQEVIEQLQHLEEVHARLESAKRRARQRDP